MPASSIFARSARNLMRKAVVKPCFEMTRLEDRSVPSISGVAFVDYNANGTRDLTTAVTNQGGGTPPSTPGAQGNVPVAIDIGLSGLTVRLFDSTGALVDTQTTGADGRWTSNATVVGQNYRIEYSGLSNGYAPAPHGADNRTAVQFADDGATNASFGAMRATEYYSNNPLLVTPQYYYGPQNITSPAIISFDYNAGTAQIDANSGQADAPAAHQLAIPASQVGSTWGIGYNRQQSTIYASSFTKRHAGWAPNSAANPNNGGPGFIYRMNIPTVGGPVVNTAAAWLNLDTAVAFIDGAAVATPISTVPAQFASWAAARNSITASTTYNWETDAGDPALGDTQNTGWDAVGKMGLGGLAVSDDGQFVYVMNLGDRRLYQIAVNADGSAGTIRGFSLPNVAGVADQSTIRPFAVEVNQGLVYIGLVNSAQGDARTSLRGYVYSFNPTTNTYSANSIANDGTTFGGSTNGFRLDYERGSSSGGQDEFLPWSTTVQTLPTTQGSGDFVTFPGIPGSFPDPFSFKYPQPMLTGLTFDNNNNLVINLRDRLGDQSGNVLRDGPAQNGLPNPIYEGFSSGDTLMAFTDVINGGSNWLLERNGASAQPGNPAVGQSGSFTLPGTGTVTWGPNDGQGPPANPAAPGTGTGGANPNGEYFGLDFFAFGTHTETSLGASVSLPGFPTVLNTHFDPQPILGDIRSAGIRWFDTYNYNPANGVESTDNGAFLKSYLLTARDQGGRGQLGSTFGKANGLGDLEAIATEPPPIEIGNRIFRDLNRNGIQDAGEPGIGGVTVELYLVGGTTPIATVVSDTDGTYYFNSTKGTNVPGTAYNVSQLVAGKAYQIRIPTNPAGLSATKANATTVQPGDDDGRDSDLVGGVINVSATGLGVSNHTYDAGFAPGLSLGNFVWNDANNNGLFDTGEAPLGNIPVTLYKSVGGVAGAVVGTKTTAGDGSYLFDSLDPGEYIVEITSPAGFRSSTGSGPAYSAATVYENNLVVGDITNNADHGFEFGGSIDTGFTIRTKAVTLADPGLPANPDTEIGGVSDGTANLRQDFGLFRAFSLGNQVWNDKNNDGLFGAGEVGIDGVSVSLYLASAFGVDGQLIAGSTPILTNATASGGFYRFDNLTAGDYVVAVQGKTGALANLVSSTGGTSATITFEPAVNATVPNDVDNRDDGTTGANNLVRSHVVTLGPTDNEPENENPVVTGLLPQGSVDKQADMTVDFGFFQPLSLGNQIFNDANNDGTLNGAEVGIDNVTVSLFRADAGGNIVGAALETQTTKNGGYYLFTGLGTDSYIVRVTTPGGFVSSSGKNGFATGPFENPAPNPNAVLTDSIDRGSKNGTFTDAAAIAISPGNAPAAGTTPGFTDTAIAADSYRIVDFGFYVPMSIGSLVWNDANNDGKFGGGELGLDGYLVTLFSDDNKSGAFEPAFDNVVATTTTSNGGQYVFTNLAPGGYFVQVTANGAKSSTGSTVAPFPYEPGINTYTDNEDHGTQDTTNTNLVRSGLVTLNLGIFPNPPAQILGDTTADGNRNYTIDFGLFTSLSVGDLVFNDLNNDGKFNGSDTGISGVLVELLSGTTVVASQTTNANGLYLFSDLSAGTYSVRITAPAGFISSTGKNGSATGDYEPVSVLVGNNDDHGTQAVDFATSKIITAAPFVLLPSGNPQNGGTANLEQDFGLFQPLSLGDLVFIDSNNDGLAAGEKGLANVPVTLLDSTGTVTIASTTTNADGNYLFTNLVPGTYVVNIAPGGKYISSSGTNGSKTGGYEPATGKTENNEDHGTQFDATNIRTTAVLLPSGQNTENNGLANLRQDFGVFEPLSLGDFVFNDLDNNGLFDGADTKMANVPVVLISNGTVIGNTATDANGNYCFGFLTPGTYTVRITPPAGFATSTAKNGSASGDAEPGFAPTVNNRDTGTNSITAPGFIDSTVTLGAPGNTTANPTDGGYSNNFVDFGLFQPLSLGSLVWIDTNNNGNYDTGETKLGNIPVSLVSNGTTIATTTTGTDGSYNFTNLIPGSYQVVITPPAGVLPSGTSTPPLSSNDNQNVGTQGPNGTIISPVVNLTLGGGPLVGGNTNSNAYVTFDFGLLALSTLSGYVYFDPNIDGNFTPGINGDSPFGGVLVTLTSDDPNFVPQTTRTNAQGYYEFLNLPPGTYTVTETQPSGQYYDGLDTPGSIPGSTSPSNDVIRVPLAPNQNSINNNFGEIPPAFVHGYVWVDLNNNCQFNNGAEPGVPNVPVTISGVTFPGSPLQGTLTPITILTDATGYYAFPVLPPGTYVISRGDLPVEVRNIYANSCLQNGDPNTPSATPGNQQFTNVQLGTPVRGPYNFGVVRINPNDPSKRNFLGSSPNVPTTPNPNMPDAGGPTRGQTNLNAAFTTTTGVPTGNALVVVGTGVGQRALVRVFDYAVGNEKFRFEPYGAYTGGVRVAQGDVDGDGVQDIITATGQGGGPRIRVFSGATGEAIKDFFAYEDTFRGGVFVAAGDVDGDGKAEIITGTEIGGGPRVRVFNGVTGVVMQDFFAFDSSQRGGVRVAAADFDNDGKADIVTTTGASVPTRVRIFKGTNLTQLQDYFAFGSTFTLGATLGVGDVDGDGQADVLVGTEAGGGPRVQIFSGKDSSVIKDFFAFDSALRSGVRVAARDIDGDGKAEIIATAGVSGAARVRMIRASDNVALEDFFALDPEFRGGAYVG